MPSAITTGFSNLVFPPKALGQTKPQHLLSALSQEERSEPLGFSSCPNYLFKFILQEQCQEEIKGDIGRQGRKGKEA